jgi:hypothetical protein
MGVSISLNQEPSEVNCHRVDSMVPHVRVLRQSTKSHTHKKKQFFWKVAYKTGRLKV